MTSTKPFNPNEELRAPSSTRRARRGRRTEKLFFQVYQHAETEKGLKLSLTGDESEAEWFPKSQIVVGDRIGKSNPPHYEVGIPRWLVEDKDFDEGQATEEASL